jgi:O-antigen ligase
LDTPDFEQLQKPLEHFRAKTKRLKVHPLENALLFVVCTQLVFQPWAIGGMRPWSQVIGLGLSVISFVIALMPRDYTGEHTGAASFRLVMWPKLMRFPIFWLGLALLGLVTTQALNPAWAYQTDGKGWWMKGIDHVNWLPTGVQVPFVRWGPWRMLLIYSSVWLTVCAMWTGFTRRRSVQALFTTLAINGLLLAALGVAQKLLANGKMFWIWEPPNGSFFSSFVYKNHAGAYLNLSLAVTCGLAAWYYLRGLRRLEKSNPSGVFAFFATCISISILVSYARGATIMMLAFLCVTVGFFIVHQLLSPSENRKPIVAFVLILIFGYFLKTGLEALHSKEAWDRIRQGIEREDLSLAGRELATKAAADMLDDYGLKGVGAGGFQFLFPIYQHRYPDLVEYAGRREFWEHAHNDVLEIPIELGLAGTLLIFGSVLYLGALLMRSYFWQNPLSGCVVFGAFLLVVYGWWDFPFQNPAILITWCVLGVAATMWTTFEEMNVKG